MSVINANPLMLGDAGYNIGRSLRFRSSASAYLSRTPAGAGNRQKFTYSLWVKRGLLTGTQSLLNVWSGNEYFDVRFDSGAQQFYLLGADSAGSLITNYGTSAIYRDPSAWYHLIVSVDTTQATAANRVVLYVNGFQPTQSGTLPAQNYSYILNSANQTVIGKRAIDGTQLFDGYLAEVNFIDGQALTPSSFGQTDPVTGVWTPKKYTGTYGTNGFYLPFSDNTSATTLAYDKSGNGNNWTPNNISTTAGATYDSMTDVPTLTSATAANYCVLNAVDKLNTIIDGNLTANSTSGYSSARGTFGISSGKWYWEQTVSVTTLNAGLCQVGGGISLSSYGLGSGNGYSGMWGFQNSNGAGSASWKFDNGAGTNSYTVFNTGDIAGFALDMSAGTLDVYRNGSLLFTCSSSISGNTVFPYASVYASGQTANSYLNFGQRPFSYTPPTGFKALNTFNLPDPTIKKPSAQMNIALYATNGATINVTNPGGFQPDLVWTKLRDYGYGAHLLTDSVRGNGASLVSNTTGAEGTRGCTISSTGFSYTYPNEGGDGNPNGYNAVAWMWKKGATPGFDIVTYTGNYNGSTGTQTIAHNLGVAPKMIIVKNRSSAFDWAVGHASIGWSKAGNLNLTNSFGASSYFNSTEPTSSVFSVGLSNISNQNSSTHVAYLFSEIAGFSKFGSYTGNGSTDGPFIYCGFRPKYVMVKRTDTVGNWTIIDTARNPSNVMTNRLYADLSNAEDTDTPADSLSNGFKVKTTISTWNASGGTYIYAAFAETPFRYSLAR